MAVGKVYNHHRMISILNKYRRVNTWHTSFYESNMIIINSFHILFMNFNLINLWYSFLCVFSGETLKYDVNFRGPLSKRSCTDVCCLFIFIAFCVSWGFVARYGEAISEKFPRKITLLFFLSIRFVHADRKLIFLFLFLLCETCVKQSIMVI